jgi:toxic protein SymE
MTYPEKKDLKQSSKGSKHRKSTSSSKDASSDQLKPEEPKVRYLKLQHHYRENRIDFFTHKVWKVPELRLCGNWLEDAGFNYGEYVSVTVRKGELIIRPKEVGSHETM